MASDGTCGDQSSSSGDETGYPFRVDMGELEMPDPSLHPRDQALFLLEQVSLLTDLNIVVFFSNSYVVFFSNSYIGIGKEYIF